MESVYASFLSNSNNKDISNATVQYVAQKAIGEDNTATFKFRPRKSVGQGIFYCKIRCDRRRKSGNIPLYGQRRRQDNDIDWKE